MNSHHYHRNQRHNREHLEQHTCTYLVLEVVQTEMYHAKKRKHHHEAYRANLHKLHVSPQADALKVYNRAEMVHQPVRLVLIKIIRTYKPIRRQHAKNRSQKGPAAAHHNVGVKNNPKHRQQIEYLHVHGTCQSQHHESIINLANSPLVLISAEEEQIKDMKLTSIATHLMSDNRKNDITESTKKEHDTIRL